MNREEIRLHILAILFRSPAYTANQATLQTQLKSIGFIVNLDQLVIELERLYTDQSAIYLKSPVPGVHVATLTREGMEHLDGSRQLHGIRVPQPGEFV